MYKGRCGSSDSIGLALGLKSAGCDVVVNHFIPEGSMYALWDRGQVEVFLARLSDKVLLLKIGPVKARRILARYIRILISTNRLNFF